MSTGPTLLARGTLSQTSLSEFLVYALDHRLEGTLILQTKSGDKSALYFTRGAPAKARLAEDNVFLADVVIDLGLVERKESLRTQKKSEELGLSHGQVLVEEGLIDETGLYVALREQIQRQVLVLCDLDPSTGFGFYDVNFLAKWGPPGEWRIKPLPLVWRALVDHLPRERAARVLEKAGDHVLKLRLEAPVARYRMSADESAVVNVLRAKPQPVATLRASGAASEALVERVVSALLLSRQLEGFSGAEDPVGLREPPESPQSLPPPGMSPAVPSRSTTSPRHPTAPPSSRGVTAHPPSPPAQNVDQFREEIERFVAAPPATYYDLLEIPVDADTSAVRAAFFRLARKWHPDRLPSELESHRATISKAFARMSEAHQVLSDSARRREYDAKLGEVPDEEAAQVATILEAASAFQRAEVLMKKRDYAAALLEARAAYEGDDSQADYIALYAWLESMGRTDQFQDLITLLDQAIELDSGNLRALWYRGQLLKKTGKTLLAMRDFRAIVAIKPSHVDALREIRVYEMRKRTDGSAGKEPPAGRATGSQPKAPGRGTTGRATTGSAPKAGQEARPSLFGRLLKKD